MAGFAIGFGFGPTERGSASVAPGADAPGPIQMEDGTPVLTETNDPILEE